MTSGSFDILLTQLSETTCFQHHFNMPDVVEVNKAGAQVQQHWTKNILFPRKKQVSLLVEVSLFTFHVDSSCVVDYYHAQTYLV